MDSKRFAIATLVGGVVLYAVGYLIFTTAFAAFYAANGGSATGVDRDGQIVWALAIANLAYAALITFAMGRRASASIGEGAMVGAVVGFLIWCTVDFVLYGTTNIANLTRTLVDPLLEIVHGGIAGAAIAAVLRPGPATALTSA
jgi:hypothetical protein